MEKEENKKFPKGNKVILIIAIVTILFVLIAVFTCGKFLYDKYITNMGSNEEVLLDVYMPTTDGNGNYR